MKVKMRIYVYGEADDLIYSFLATDAPRVGERIVHAGDRENVREVIDVGWIIASPNHEDSSLNSELVQVQVVTKAAKAS